MPFQPEWLRLMLRYKQFPFSRLNLPVRNVQIQYCSVCFIGCAIVESTRQQTTETITIEARNAIDKGISDSTCEGKPEM